MKLKLLVIIFSLQLTSFLLALDSSPQGPITNRSPEVRLTELNLAFSNSYQHAITWTWFWGISFGVSTVGSFVAIPFFEADKTYDSKPDLIVNGIESSLALIPMLLSPFKILKDYPHFKSQYQSPNRNATKLLSQAESMYENEAMDEAANSSLWMHVFNLGVSLLTGAVLGFGYQHWTSAYLSSGVGFAIGEIYLFSQPMGLANKWRREKQAANTQVKNNFELPVLTFNLHQIGALWTF